MIIEATRLLRAALEDPLAGVNALIPHLPLDATDELPPNVRVCDWSNDTWAVRDTIPQPQLSADLALLVLRPATDEMPAPIPGNPELRNQGNQFALAILYAARIDARQDKTVIEAARDAAYTIRAVQRCLMDWRERTDIPGRTRNGCVLSEILNVSTVLFEADVASGYVGMGLTIELRMTDRWAEGITPLTP